MATCQVVSKGTAKVISYKKETGCWGDIASATGAKQLRRVTGSFNLMRESFESNEIRTDRQLADFRLGVKSVDGSLNGELSGTTYADFMAGILARDFTATTAITGLTVTIATTATTGVYTITRTAGSWITDGATVGTVVRLSGASVTPADVNKNLLVSGVTALVLTVATFNGDTLTPASAVASVTATTAGKTTFVPKTGHTEDSFTLEEWYSDILQSQVYTGLKVGSMNVQMPATGLATVDFKFTGKDMAQSGTSQYFTSPASQGTNGIYASVNGKVLVNGVPVALITTADFTVERALENAVAVGSNSLAEIFTGRIKATGNMSVYFIDGSFRDNYKNETTISVVFTLTKDSTANSDFISFVLPKVKMSSFTVDDKELGLTASVAFQALLNDDVTAGLPATTILIQDSALV
jgi:hypothetical protein